MARLVEVNCTCAPNRASRAIHLPISIHGAVVRARPRHPWLSSGNHCECLNIRPLATNSWRAVFSARSAGIIEPEASARYYIINFGYFLALLAKFRPAEKELMNLIKSTLGVPRFGSAACSHSRQFCHRHEKQVNNPSRLPASCRDLEDGPVNHRAHRRHKDLRDHRLFAKTLARLPALCIHRPMAPTASPPLRRVDNLLEMLAAVEAQRHLTSLNGGRHARNYFHSGSVTSPTTEDRGPSR